jgi:hypothetical protein
MEESLHSWLSIAFVDIMSIEIDGNSDVENYSNINDMDKLLTLGRYIFGLTESADCQEIFKEFDSHFGRDLTQYIENSFTFFIEACLICSVSSLSTDRARFVQAIMRMEPNAQTHIMESIKNNLQHYFDADQSENEEEEDDSHVVQNLTIESDGFVCEASTPNISVSSSSLRYDDDEVKECNQELLPCFRCGEIQKEAKQLSMDLELIVKREIESEAKLRVEITIQTNKLLDAEILIIQKDEKLSENSILLETAQKNVLENDERIRECNRVINQLQVIQDEIDILKPKADRADASDQQLEKLRSRLDELKGLLAHNTIIVPP